MKNLNRALRMALKYRWSLIASLACSAAVAVLWSLNLGVVYPFVEVVIKGKSLHQWVANEDIESKKLIAESRTKIADLELELEQPELTPSEAKSLENKISSSRYDIKIQETRSVARAKVAPYIQKYAPKSPFTTLVYMMVLMFAGTLLRGLFLVGSMVFVARVGQRTMLDMQNQVFQNVLHMEASELGVKGTGDLIGRIRGETGAICKAINTLFGKTTREPLKMAGCLIGAALVNWRLLLFSLLICPLAAWGMLKLAQVTKRANRKAMEDSAKLLNRLYQAITYMRVVKAFTNETGEQKRFERVANDVYNKSMRISLFSALSRVNNELLGVSMISLSVLAGGYLVLNTQTHLLGIRMCDAPMGFGSLMLFFTFLIGISDPLRKMADVYNMIQSGVVAADRVFPVIDQIPAIQDPADPVELPNGELEIQFDQVRFEYDQGKPILNGITERVPAGTSLAIIGHNGCGKSTLINLIPRFFDTCSTTNDSSGSIQIGGHDIRHYRVRELRENIGYVTQRTMLFNDSIAQNIAYGREQCSREEVVAAARKAHADEFISELEDGYDSMIGEHGGKLSGGQRQRLSLARAILKDPRILILDEATSQIDPESEKLIHETLADFIKGRTTVVITHRMSTLELVDRIMIMKDGRIVDCGTHEQLLARCPEYQRMRNLHLEEAA